MFLAFDMSASQCVPSGRHIADATSMNFSKQFQTQGFTLIESMVSVSLLGILMGVALPSLERHWQQVRRQDAQSALGQLHLRQSQWRGLHPQYAATLVELSWPSNVSTSGHYILSLQNVTAQSFELKATPIGLQARDTDCQSMHLQQRPDGAVSRTSNLETNTDTARCWTW